MTDFPKALASFVDLPRLPRDEEGPVFAEAWQAQVFALTTRLHEIECFSLTEWSTALGAEIHQAEERREPDDGSHYYEHWLAALEGLLVSKGLTDPASLLRRKSDWYEAYRSTPHGQPVELK
jgi:nitrile hydratase accessory protein